MSDLESNTANTAARKHGKPGREARPKSTTIDSHSHVGVPAAGAYIKPHLDLSTIPLAHFSTAETQGTQRQTGSGHPPVHRLSYDERFAIMDAMGVDMQFVMPPPPQCYYTVRARTSP